MVVVVGKRCHKNISGSQRTGSKVKGSISEVAHSVIVDDRVRNISGSSSSCHLWETFGGQRRLYHALNNFFFTFRTGLFYFKSMFFSLYRRLAHTHLSTQLTLTVLGFCLSFVIMCGQPTIIRYAEVALTLEREKTGTKLDKSSP